MQAVNRYTDAQRSATPQKRQARNHAAVTSTSAAASALSSLSHGHTSSSLNSVVHLLESTDPSRRVGAGVSTSTSHIPMRWQCRHCSYVYKGGQHTDGGPCSMCSVGSIAKARAGAQTNPDVFKSAMDVANTITMAEQAHIPHTTTTSNSRARPHVPSAWPRGRNCDACNRRLAVMYCSLCTYTHTHTHQNTYTHAPAASCCCRCTYRTLSNRVCVCVCVCACVCLRVCVCGQVVCTCVIRAPVNPFSTTPLPRMVVLLADGCAWIQRLQGHAVGNHSQQETQASATHTHLIPAPSSLLSASCQLRHSLFHLELRQLHSARPAARPCRCGQMR